MQGLGNNVPARYRFRVTGDHSRMTYSEHRSRAAAIRAAKALTAKWTRENGWCHPGSEPAAEDLTAHGWQRIWPIY